MKQKTISFALIIAFSVMNYAAIGQSPKGLAISVSQTEPHPSAILDVSSSNQGVLFPRLTTAERDSINLPAAGLVVYDKDISSFFYYQSGWKELANSIWSTDTSGNIHYTNGKIGMGTTNPNPSAVLDVSSSNKGVLLPRMATSARDSITQPAIGLIVYDTDSSSFYYFDNGWKRLGDGGQQDGLWDSDTTGIIFYNGKVGIGTDDPKRAFDVKNANNDKPFRVTAEFINTSGPYSAGAANIMASGNNVESSSALYGLGVQTELSGPLPEQGAFGIGSLFITETGGTAIVSQSFYSGNNTELDSMEMMAGIITAIGLHTDTLSELAIMAVGIASGSESTQSGVNIGALIMSENAAHSNIGVVTFTNASDEEIDEFTNEAIFSRDSLSAGMVIFNPNSLENDYGIYCKANQNFIDGKLHVKGLDDNCNFRIEKPFTPPNSTYGNLGDFTWDDDFLYIRTSEGWKKAALLTLE